MAIKIQGSLHEVRIWLLTSYEKPAQSGRMDVTKDGIAMDTGTNPTPLVRGLNNTIPPNIDNDNKEYADRVFQVRLLIMSVW